MVETGFRVMMGRIIIELYNDIVPKTKYCCTVERGLGATSGKPLHYTDLDGPIVSKKSPLR
jgi:hypothetical protein